MLRASSSSCVALYAAGTYIATVWQTNPIHQAAKQAAACFAAAIITHIALIGAMEQRDVDAYQAADHDQAAAIITHIASLETLKPRNINAYQAAMKPAAIRTHAALAGSVEHGHTSCKQANRQGSLVGKSSRAIQAPASFFPLSKSLVETWLNHDQNGGKAASNAQHW